MRAAALTLALAALLPVAHASAQGESVSTRRVGVHWRDGAPEVVFSARDLADSFVRDELRSGTPKTLVMRVYAYRENGQPIAMAARSCRVLYDPWERAFRVQVQDARVDRVESFNDLDAVVRRCLVVRRMRVGTVADYRALAGESVYFAAVIEMNPLSPETVHQIRRWLAHPAGGGVGEEAFFGSFVSLFVNRRIGSAERTLQFRSQLVRVAP